MNQQLIDDLLNEPDVYLLLEEFEVALKDEAERRKIFQENAVSRAEFINGEVVMHSPVTMKHNKASLLLAQLLNIHVNKNDLGFVGIAKIMITLTRNDYEPDICFFNKEKSDCFTKNQMLFPAPDLVVEITSPSTEHRDKGVKFKDYQAHSIEEYWIIDPEHETVEHYHLKGEKYELVLKSSSGTVTSLVVPGFQIAISAIFNEAENLKAIQSF